MPWARNQWGLAVVCLEQSLGLGDPPALNPTFDEPSWMRSFEREGIGGMHRSWKHQRVALAVATTQNCVGELTPANAMAAFRKLDRLGYGGVRRYTVHVQQLRGAQSKEVVQVGIEPIHAAIYPSVEKCVEQRSSAQHAIHKLADPTSIPRI